LTDLPFAQELTRVTKHSLDFLAQHPEELKRALPDDQFLGYDRLPKGAIPFHRYSDHVRTAFEEHLHEMALLTKGAPETVVHFTVPVTFGEEEKARIQVAAKEIGLPAGCHIHVTFSHQDPATDTIALGQNGEPFRRADGSLLFRPGGHGALINNLNETRGDLVFIKNIDNVLPDRNKQFDADSKAILGGFLLQLQNERNALVRDLHNRIQGAEKVALNFLSQWFLRGDTYLEASAEQLIEWLDRPMRVCGMVRNEGQPGGGPFWLRGENGLETAQIIEAAQLDADDPTHQKLLHASTHFNPVDIVCAINDPNGQPYPLHKYLNRRRAFVTRKPHEGEMLTVLEHPGLWNGSMEHWLTVFVEVNSATFAPVKTVVDLLRPAHFKA
jgi:hypothetical protein